MKVPLLSAQAPPVALIPAAGLASRLGPLPCSKEILPIQLPDGGARAICDHLLDALATAGVTTGFLVLSPGKWDIPEYLEARTERWIKLAYLTVADSPSVPHTLDRACPFLQGRRVVLGFPDILFRPLDAVRVLIDRQEKTGTDLALALFPTAEPEKCDMVELDEGGAVRQLVIKQAGCTLRYTWSLAVWTPRFTDYLHRFVQDRAARPAGDDPSEPELYVGDVIQAAIHDGLSCAVMSFPDGESLDIGTPESLHRASEFLGSVAADLRVGRGATGGRTP